MATEIDVKYARKEPTTDGMKIYPSFKRFLDSKQDVVIYNDKECKDFYARFPWDYDSKPDKRNKYAVINCYRWKIQWLPDLDINPE